jgi:D-lactate dehydrogenase
MLDVFFYEAFAEEEEELRRLLPEDISAGYAAETIQETQHDGPPARLISIRTQSQIPPKWAPSLEAILSRSTGYDHLTAYAATVKRAPKLAYLPLYCSRAVAEHAMLMWMSLLRRLPRQMEQFTTFHRDGLTGVECQDSVLSVFGVGNIGREACLLGKAVGMRVLGVDLNPRYDDVKYVSIVEALAAADVVVCAMDLNSGNRGYFDAEKWQHVKPGAVFVNVSRGELSPSTVLLEALESGQLSGVGLDVYDNEIELAGVLRDGEVTSDAEVEAALSLSVRDDVICTPHNAFNSRQAVERKSLHSVQQIIAWRDTGHFLWKAPDV